MTQTTFEQRIDLLVAFAACVDALPQAAWQRLHRRCEPLTGRAPDAVLARALLAAAPYELGAFADPSEKPLLIRAITGVGGATVLSMSLAFETVRTYIPLANDPLWRRRGSTGKPVHDRAVDAFYRLEDVMLREQVREPGVATAVRAASHALLQQQHLSQPAFERIYRWVETEIPFDALSSNYRS